MNLITLPGGFLVTDRNGTPVRIVTTPEEVLSALGLNLKPCKRLPRSTCSMSQLGHDLVKLLRAGEKLSAIRCLRDTLHDSKGNLSLRECRDIIELMCDP